MEGGDREEEVKESHLELKEIYVRVHIHANARADAHARTHAQRGIGEVKLKWGSLRVVRQAGRRGQRKSSLKLKLQIICSSAPESAIASAVHVRA